MRKESVDLFDIAVPERLSCDLDPDGCDPMQLLPEPMFEFSHYCFCFWFCFYFTPTTRRTRHRTQRNEINFLVMQRRKEQGR